MTLVGTPPHGKAARVEAPWLAAVSGASTAAFVVNRHQEKKDKMKSRLKCWLLEEWF